MRTLELNKTELWCVEQIDLIPILDINGYDTGEVTKVFNTPRKIKLALQPSDGIVSNKIFGIDSSLDKISISNDVVLTEKSLLFLSEPVSNFDTTYEYAVSKIKKSLNTYNYGLRNRTK